jgi:ribosomal protein L7Ae-like RNA K-turn-binding protein
LVLGPDHEVVVDAQDGSFGRGAYVHATRVCLEKASRTGLARAVRGAPRLDGSALTVEALAQAVVDAYGRRVVGLLAAARRARKLTWGADAVAASLAAGDASLVIVATDAAAAADRSEVRAAVREGRAIAWSDKATLGRLARGEDAEVGVVAVTDTRLSEAIREARTVVDVASSVLDRPVSRTKEQPSPASRHASILDEGAASLLAPDLSGSGAGGPALGSAE